MSSRSNPITSEGNAGSTGVKKSENGCCSCFSFFKSCFTKVPEGSRLLANEESSGNYQSVAEEPAAPAPAPATP